METIILPLSLIVINPEYAGAFPPMPGKEYQLLKDNIRLSGMHTPIIVCPTTPLPRGEEQTYTALAGHNRYQIHKELGIMTIRASVAITTEEKISALFDNIYRRQLDAATVARFRAKEALIRRGSQARIIPSLLEVYGNFTADIQDIISKLDEGGQEQLLETMTNATRLKPKRPTHTSLEVSRTDVPIVDPSQTTQALTRKLTEVEDALREEQRSSLQLQNKLARDLESAREARQALEDRIASMKDQVELAESEVNAARLVADERLGRTNGLTDIPPAPFLLLQGLNYAQQLTAHLSLFAAKVPTLNQADAIAAQQALRNITIHLNHLHELLLPTHDGLIAAGRNGKPNKGGTLSLVGES